MHLKDFERYTLGLIALFKEEALWGSNRYYASKKQTEKSNDYELGYAVAYSRVISLIIQEAEVYGISLSELGLENLDPDKDLVPA